MFATFGFVEITAVNGTTWPYTVTLAFPEGLELTCRLFAGPFVDDPVEGNRYFTSGTVSFEAKTFRCITFSSVEASSTEVPHTCCSAIGRVTAVEGNTLKLECQGYDPVLRLTTTSSIPISLPKVDAWAARKAALRPGAALQIVGTLEDCTTVGLADFEFLPGPQRQDTAPSPKKSNHAFYPRKLMEPVKSEGEADLAVPHSEGKAAPMPPHRTKKAKLT